MNILLHSKYDLESFVCFSCMSVVFSISFFIDFKFTSRIYKQNIDISSVKTKFFSYGKIECMYRSQPNQ